MDHQESPYVVDGWNCFYIKTLAGSNALLQQLDLLWRQSWHQSPILCSLSSLLQQSVAPLPLGRPSSPRPCCTCPALVSREDLFICTKASGPCRGHFSAWSVLDPPGSPSPVLMSPLTWKFPNSATGGIVFRSSELQEQRHLPKGVYTMRWASGFFSLVGVRVPEISDCLRSSPVFPKTSPPEPDTGNVRIRSLIKLYPNFTW